MPLRLVEYIAPTAEPIHLTDAKLHLRLAADAAGAVLYTTDDALLQSHITAARMTAEAETWTALVQRTYDLYLDSWPVGDEIILDMPPLKAVDSIVYTTSDGVENTLSDYIYEVDTSSFPGRVVLAYEQSWPDETLAPRTPIRIRYKAGYATPFSVNYSTDTLTAINHPFANGDMVRVSVSGGSLPTGLSAMTDYYVRDVSGNTLKLSATSGGSAVDISSAGTGQFFLGEVPANVIVGMKLILSDLYDERADTVLTRAGVVVATLPRAASHHFALNSARRF